MAISLVGSAQFQCCVSLVDQIQDRWCSSSALRTANSPPAVGSRQERVLRWVAAAASSEEDAAASEEGNAEDVGKPVGAQSESNTGKQAITLSLKTVNPVGLGRRSRQIFDDVWRRLNELGQLTSSPRTKEEYDNVLIGGPMCEFTIPNADNTTILVAGATSRVGRVLIRKLLLRGYKIKALVRTSDPQVLETLPRSVQVVVGDLGEPDTLKAAVEGCNKIICCATARYLITGDLNRVDNRGVYNLAKAFQDFNHRMAQSRAGQSSKSKLLIAKFNRPNSLDGWIVQEGTYFIDEIGSKYTAGMDAEIQISEDGNAVFSGFVFTRGGYVEMLKKLSLPLGFTLDRYEGLVLSVCGDGKSYVLLLETSSPDDGLPNRLYFARFLTRVGYSRIRIPFSTFRPLNPDDPPLHPFLIHKIGIRFEPRRQRPVATRESMGRNGAPNVRDSNSFKLVLDYIKALPTGEETDFILVSCSGPAIDPEQRERIIKAKQEEPGGQRALVFDQGNRITQGISCADVADVCVKALHNPAARNKSFDVCYEYKAEEGEQLYELVAHLPDKSNNYLTPALVALEKNT
ncbi:hypothetical protein O6H91_03G050000 [Diphasiastrum complanatum]|uniref:Uncharacterized protein n=1 Tax=Diphasiastrum complanatum TaxID=34168 RepID=A0ACC2E644_DIPCM|nr:hypothetical protein O6H91_03G050000 [Diphasiastrum complanatum]